MTGRKTRSERKALEVQYAIYGTAIDRAARARRRRDIRWLRRINELARQLSK